MTKKIAKPEPVVKTQCSGHCTIYVEGIDFPCPLCRTVVKSGERHECWKEAK